MDLPVIGADIWNAYLQAPSSEKHYIICGPEFGIENEGCVVIICCALYGGELLDKISGTISTIAWVTWGSPL